MKWTIIQGNYAVILRKDIKDIKKERPHRKRPVNAFTELDTIATGTLLVRRELAEYKIRLPGTDIFVERHLLDTPLNPYSLTPVRVVLSAPRAREMLNTRDEYVIINTSLYDVAEVMRGNDIKINASEVALEIVDPLRPKRRPLSPERFLAQRVREYAVVSEQLRRESNEGMDTINLEKLLEKFLGDMIEIWSMMKFDGESQVGQTKITLQLIGSGQSITDRLRVYIKPPLSGSHFKVDFPAPWTFPDPTLEQKRMLTNLKKANNDYGDYRSLSSRVTHQS